MKKTQDVYFYLWSSKKSFLGDLICQSNVFFQLNSNTNDHFLRFQVMIGEDTLLKFSGVPLGEACTIIIRGATQQILDEADRSLHDALCVLAATVKESSIIYGGGCSEMAMACAVMKAAASTPGKEAVAMEAFARALQQLPTIIADNAGYDTAQLISELRAAHNLGNSTMGLGLLNLLYNFFDSKF